ncbi:hypothetical protein [Empedobacter falsenii]
MDTIKKTNGNYLFDKFVGILLAVIYPIFGFLFSLRYIDKKWFQIVVVILCTYFGYTMYVEDPIYDSSRYKDFFLEVYWIKKDYFSFLVGQINSIYVQDYYESTTAYLISRFTKDYQVYFGFLGFVFGYIYSKNIYLTSQFISKKNIFSILFFFSFLFLYGPWAINGARYGTATQLFIFVVFNYFLYNNKKILYILLVIPLIHFSFLLPIFLLLTYFLFKKLILKAHTLFLFLFVSSFLLDFFVTEFFNNIVHYFPAFLANKIIAYTSLEAINEFNNEKSNLSLLAKLADFSGKFYFIGAYIFIYLYTKKNLKKLQSIDVNFISFFLYYASVFSVLAFLPSFSRFINLSIILSFVIILKLIKNYQLTKRINNCFILASIGIFLLIYVGRSIRYGMLFLGDGFLKSSPLFIFFN